MLDEDDLNHIRLEKAIGSSARASGFACNSTTNWLGYGREAGRFMPAALALRLSLRIEQSRGGSFVQRPDAVAIGLHAR